MKKIIKNGNTVIVVLDNGSILTKSVEDSAELFERVKTMDAQEDIVLEMVDEYSNIKKERTEIEEYFNTVKKSNILKINSNSVYWKGVSELSMPKTFVEAVLEAEQSDNKDSLEAFRNFWILLSLNPDAECRDNLYWFLSNWDMKISKSGLFVAYRNVNVYQEGTKDLYCKKLCEFAKEVYSYIESMGDNTSLYWIYDYDGDNEPKIVYTGSKDFLEIVNNDIPILNLKSTYNELKAVNFKYKNLGNDTVYTDGYTGTFRIKVGEIVSMPREKCNSDSGCQCSSGLHLARRQWLKNGYFGTQGLVCLCNPASVVAVPRNSDYGKLRTCEYLPIALCEYDDNGDVIEHDVDNGFESKWITEILYDGELSTEETPKYRVEVPNIPELNKTTIDENLLSIARKYIKWN